MDSVEPQALPALPKQYVEFPIRVKRVLDGDTVEAEITLANVLGIMSGFSARHIRLDGIDCPELNQAGGPEAKSFTEKFLRSEVGILYVRVNVNDCQDKYGRLLGDIVRSVGAGGASLVSALKEAGYVKPPVQAALYKPQLLTSKELAWIIHDCQAMHKSEIVNNPGYETSSSFTTRRGYVDKLKVMYQTVDTENQ